MNKPMILGFIQDSSYQAGRVVGQVFLVLLIIVAVVAVIRKFSKPK